MRWAVEVPGVAVPQGSMAAVKGRVVHSQKRRRSVDLRRPVRPSVQSWRKTIATFGRTVAPAEPYDGAVALDVVFYLPKPRSVKPGPAHRKPDLDKLVRAVGDALEGIWWTQDSRITELRARKLYADRPRCVITARAVDR